MRKKPDTWMQKYWRPLIAIAYIIIILFDFVIAPMLWSTLQAIASGSVIVQWSPLTLLSGGVFHAAIGAVLGVSAFTRGQEKIERLRTDYYSGEEPDKEEPTNDR